MVFIVRRREKAKAEPSSLDGLGRDLASCYPGLAAEWHPFKNGDLKASHVSLGSGRKVWWLCAKGHEWKTTPRNRVNGSRCPVCSGRIPSVDNNLAARDPDLAEQWHPIKNGLLTPFDVIPGSERKVWWLCENGHEWEATPSSRRRGRGCPYCANRKVTLENSLAFKFPSLAKEWHPTRNGDLTPEQVVSGSGKTVWWMCENGHEWKARVVDRAAGRGCRKCLGQEAHSGHNLALSFPHLVKEWHPTRNGDLTPDLVAPRSNKKVWWRCSRGHEWESTVSNRAKGQKCPNCKPNTSLSEIRLFCELKTLFPEVSWRNRLDGVECDIYISKYRAAVEYDGAFWHVERNEQDAVKNERLAAMGVRLFRVRGHGLSKLFDTDIILSPTQTRDLGIIVVKTLLKTMRGILTLDEQDTRRVVGYFLRGQFANPKEFRRIVSCLPGPPQEKSLMAEEPELVKQWHFQKNAPLTPEMFYSGSQKKLWWICEKGHEWKAVISSRVKGAGCPYCAGQRALPEHNLAVKCPDLLREWHPFRNGDLSADMVTPKSHQEIWWICEAGHEWKCSPKKRLQGCRCPGCTGRVAGEHCRKPLSNEYNLARLLPSVANEWHPTKNGDLRPEMLTPGSHKKIWWRCHQGHEWKAVVSSRAQGVGCPTCAGKQATSERNLAALFPEIAKQWHPTKKRKICACRGTAP